ncbi:DUF2778 domain-containing protein [Geobacter hydrogenophilus]|uniref:tlde1 domain-containing protein n=1 Tax=Geobacter hydrogenophilus TaxID=40983 RepID=UPI001BD9C324|nr:DUF2778 domain-containing protein [Geobacter hydrogenophilus]
MANLRFSASQGKLTVTDSRGTYTVNATSGRGNCLNNPACQPRENVGPLPSGQYFIFRREINNPNALGDLARNIFTGDWGDWRAPIRTSSWSAPYGRKGFFLHGGTSPGSAGCIDIGGGVFGNSTTDRVLKSIKEVEVSTLWVD